MCVLELIYRAIEALYPEQYAATPFDQMAATISEGINPSNWRDATFTFSVGKLEKLRLKSDLSELAKELSESISAIEESTALLSNASPYRLEATGPFINVWVPISTLAIVLVSEETRNASNPYFPDEKKEVDETKCVMIEFSQPNTHKVFHVGHLRNAILGDTLVRLYRHVDPATRVIPVNYFGDQGVHVATCLSKLRQLLSTATLEEVINGRNPANVMGEIYSWAVKDLDEALAEDKPALQARVAEVLQRLEDRSDGELIRLFETTREMCITEFKRIYHWLGIQFEHDFYESEMEQLSQELVDQGLTRGVLVAGEFKSVVAELGRVTRTVSGGMWEVMRVPPPRITEDLGVCVLRKRNGSGLYATKDIALAVYKNELAVKIMRNGFVSLRSLHVVDQSQSRHLQQVFEICKRMGIEGDRVHVPYGPVKMSSRLGNVQSCSTLIKSLTDRIAETMYPNESLTPDVKERIEALALGTIRYGMLKVDPTRDVVFDLEAWTDLKGNTGPYVQYAYARLCTLLAANPVADPFVRGTSFTWEMFGDLEGSRTLMNQIHRSAEVIARAKLSNNPCVVATHLYQTCQALSKWYEMDSNRLSRMEDGSMRKMLRVWVLQNLKKVLKTEMTLLGVPTLERV